MSKRALVVDDEEDVRNYVVRRVMKAGCEVVEADNAETALEKINNSDKFDLVITDIRMPGKYNGLDLLTEIRKKYLTQPPVIFVTGYGDISVEEAFDKGVFSILSKPFTRKEADPIIGEALRFPVLEKYSDTTEVDQEFNIELSSLHGAIEDKSFLLGHGGLFLATSDFVSIGDLVRFRINFLEKSPAIQCPDKICGVGRVVWKRELARGDLKSGFGCRFLQLGDGEVAFLKKYVEANQINAFVPRG